MRSAGVLRIFPERVGWTPVMWLIYLAFPIIAVLTQPHSAEQRFTEGVGLVAFLALYVAAYNTASAPANWLAIGGITALGAFLSVYVDQSNYGIFIYAASFAGLRASRRQALVGIALIGLTEVALAVAGLIDPAVAEGGVVIGSSVGVVNLAFRAQIDAYRRLDAAQREISRLARIEERERIARDLHDLLGQTLSVVILKSDLARRLLGDQPDRAAAELEAVSRVARQALEEMRAAIAGYRSDGIGAELARAKDALGAASIACEEDVAQLSMPPAAEGTIALALRESVTNVLRHSGARRCRIEIRAEGNAVRLAVDDDGHGAPDERTGSGIRGMRERLEALGGTLDLLPGLEGRGLRVLARMPLATTATGVTP